MPLVTTYNPRNINITPVVRQLNNISKTDDNMQHSLIASGSPKTWEEYGTLYVQNDIIAVVSYKIVENVHILHRVLHLISEERNSTSEKQALHKQHIRVPEYRNIGLSEHIDICGHGQFRVFPFYWLHRKKSKIKIALTFYSALSVFYLKKILSLYLTGHWKIYLSNCKLLDRTNKWCHKNVLIINIYSLYLLRVSDN